MSKQFIKLLLVFALCANLTINWTYPIKAQSSPLSTASVVDENSNAVVLVTDPNIVTWQMLGLDESNLVGPTDSSYFSFNLPADWKLIEGASLNLSLGVSVNKGIQNESSSPTTVQDQLSTNGIIGAGTLTVKLNNIVLTVLPLDRVGEVENKISIPTEALASRGGDGLMEVEIIFESGASCYNFDQANAVIRQSSYFTLPHQSIQPSTNLVNFPKPIFQNSFIPDSALLIIPDQPSAAELQAALTVAAGLDKLSYSTVAVDMVIFSKLTPEQQTANHLIFVGNSASLPVLGQLRLPFLVGGGEFKVIGGTTDDGFIEMVNSPWNNAKAILVVSGNTDQGTIKAAQALSTGVFRPNEFPNVAVVQEVQTTPVPTLQPTDQTLTSLGYYGRVFERKGVGNVSYIFNVPPGWTVAADASFGLVFGHSALIDYNSSGIVILLNGKPIGSVRMSDVTANLSTNKVLINIPASAVIPGKNRLEVRVNLLPYGDCTPENMRGLWINIWPDSMLHLPLELTPINPVASISLASYPAPFIYFPLLDNTAIVLQRNDVESWQAALKIAGFLGSYANGPVTALKVYYSDDFPEDERSKYNLLIIGRPSQMPIMGEVNSTLPVPFLDGSDVLADGNFQVTYRIPRDVPMGYLEIMPSPWNSDNIILAVLGNTSEGLRWSTSSLIDPDLRYRLAGNIAVINNKQIITADTRLSPATGVNPSQAAEVVVLPPSVETNSLPLAVQQSAWVFPVLVISVILILLILIFVVVSSWSRHRTRRKVHSDEYQANDQAASLSTKNWLSAFFEKIKKR